MKVMRIVSLLVVLALFAPMFAIGQEAKPNPTAVAVAETVTKTVAKTVTDGAVEVAKDATEKAGEAVGEAKGAVASAVSALTPSEATRGKFADAMISFLNVGKEALEDGVGIVKDGSIAAGKFAGTQIPLVLSELIALRRFEVLAMFLSTVGIGIATFWAGRKFWKWINDPENKELNGSEAEGVFALVAILMQICGILIPLLIVITNLREWILPWAAPRVYLLEYALDFINKVK